MTKAKFLFLAFFSLTIFNPTFGQRWKFESFTTEQTKFKKDISKFLEAKLKDRSNKSFSDLQSNKFIAVQPMGMVFDSRMVDHMQKVKMWILRRFVKTAFTLFLLTQIQKRSKR